MGPASGTTPHRLETPMIDHQYTPFDPSLYEAFGSPREAESHFNAGRVVRLRDGKVYPSYGDTLASAGHGGFAPFVEPKPFANAREGVTWLLKPGAKMVTTQDCSVSGLVRQLSPSGSTLLGGSQHYPLVGITWTVWRPWCPVWDARKPSAKEIWSEAVEALNKDLEKVLKSYGCLPRWGGRSQEITHNFGKISTDRDSLVFSGPALFVAVGLTNCKKPESE